MSIQGPLWHGEYSKIPYIISQQAGRWKEEMREVSQFTAGQNQQKTSYIPEWKLKHWMNFHVAISMIIRIANHQMPC